MSTPEAPRGEGANPEADASVDPTGTRGIDLVEGAQDSRADSLLRKGCGCVLLIFGALVLLLIGVCGNMRGGHTVYLEAPEAHLIVEVTKVTDDVTVERFSDRMVSIESSGSGEEIVELLVRDPQGRSYRGRFWVWGSGGIQKIRTGGAHPFWPEQRLREVENRRRWKEKHVIRFAPVLEDAKTKAGESDAPASSEGR